MSFTYRSLVATAVLLAAGALAPAPATAADNYAPFWVENDGPEPLPEYERAAGPYWEERAGTQDLTALRPFWVELDNDSVGVTNSYSFYPIFSLWQKEGSYDWNIYHLIRGAHTEVEGGHDIGRFEAWPFFWHYDTGDPETSYDALFPIAGTLKGRLFYRRIDWVGFPIYARFAKRDYADTTVLWPIFRVRNGPTDSGWGVWPLYGHFEGEGSYNNTYALWPLIYNNYKYRGDREIYHATGVLPLWTSETAPGLHSETYLWPFFGYTVERDPRPDYREIRYFYPFVVQGRGEERYVNRLLPIYAHETKPDYEKKWYGWPLLKTETQQLGAIRQESQRVLFFLYRNTEQTVPGRDDFHARKTSLWPLFSSWDDGDGHRQFQALSPFEPFFPGNKAVQSTWAPFFALYRYEAEDDAARHSVLWDLVYWQHSNNGHEFSLGPLYEQKSSPDGAKWSLLKGLLTIRRPDEGGTKFSGLWGLFH